MKVCLAALGLGLLSAAVVLARLGAVEGVRTEEVILEDPPEQRLRARLYLPDRHGRLPAVLVCHGISNSKENLAPTALAFAQRGLVVLSLDFGGHGESAPRPLSEKGNVGDVRRALAYLAARPEVDD